ncbi:elongation factor 1-beta [Candidatus Woesearchaeota archaeon CG08_land_8_20_14_0_20_47_9]|nr:MAG: hypothetical protein AUJ69_00835 [Candidatus Woesearchaeota archaeon CG1_02_47_18]PIN72981.1 MAG: elongation factor 1-beta [Candidatus Woesearchaeota archaeon CG10_big_fil_rev_8_21_14_0_10_47_5]PIO03346.1 MAG: elongation factor 1-beta [Candidatus Woesearchaeota archaeon CG08_land_8_20_14_0_20_47_9]HII30400.1 elongation factor 1-beta [Candidatus Woesearchaeota archaeon]
MGVMIVTLRIMPEGVEINLEPIKKRAVEIVTEFGGRGCKAELNEVAFGLKAIMLMFSVDEKLGSTEKLEKKIAAIKGVSSAEVTDLRRAIG